MQVTTAMEKYATAELNELYQKLSKPDLRLTPHFQVDELGSNAKPLFRCQLTCPGFTLGNRTFTETSFFAVALSKKEAQQKASKEAMMAFQAQGFAPKVPRVLTEEERHAEAKERLDKLAALVPRNIDEAPMDELRVALKAVRAEIKWQKRSLEAGEGCECPIC